MDIEKGTSISQDGRADTAVTLSLKYSKNNVRGASQAADSVKLF